MVVEKIFEVAREKPDKIAIYYGLHPITYGAFAFWISHVRNLLEPQGLRPEGVAVLDIDSLLDAWVFGLALQSPGITTLPVPSLETLEKLRLRDIGCLIVTSRESTAHNPLPLRNGKRFQIPHHYCLQTPVAEALPRPRRAEPTGGHILLTSGTTGDYKMVL